MDLVKLIKQDMENKEGKYLGGKYYSYDNQTDRQEDFVSQDREVYSTRGKSNSLYTNYFKMLIDQKVDYLLAKEPTTNQPYFSSYDITDKLEDILFLASLDGRTWVHLYTVENKIKFICIPDIQIIPFYTLDNELETLIRYYCIDYEKKRYEVEIWTKQGVKTVIIEDSKIVSTYESSHYVEKEIFNDEVVDEKRKNFGVIPFLEVRNNKKYESDLEPIKPLIDCYNELTNGLVDNINKFQDMLMKLKGFVGDEESINEAMRLLRKHKAVGIPEGADVEYISIEIPTEARKILFDIIENNIFKIGRGVNPDKLGDGNLTNVVIKSRYAGLDMKANQSEKQLKLFYEKFISFYDMFSSLNTDKKVIFNRSMIFNTSEVILDCVNSIGIISKETIVKNHPWVTDYEIELKLLEKEKEKEIKTHDSTIQDVKISDTK